MQAKQAIRKVMVTIQPGASIGDAADLMNRAVVGALVVVDGDRPVGIVTDRDLVVRAMVKRLPLDARIDSVMTSSLFTLPADADLRDALKVFSSHAIRRLPLVEGERVVGMLTLDDLAINCVNDLATLFHPVVGQVIFGAPEREGAVAVP
jgi:CBS domain-containing protein